MPSERIDGDPTGDEAGVPDAVDGLVGDGSTGSPVADRVQRLLAPVVATAQVQLFDVEWTGGTLRVVLDREGGVGTDTLAQVNRLISPILDQHDPVPGRYTLEVSSPGVERPLRRLDHFRRAVGEDVVVKTSPGVEPRRLKGQLQAVADGRLELDVTEVDGVDLPAPEQRTVQLADVASARTVYDWDAARRSEAAEDRPASRPPQRQSQRKARRKSQRKSPQPGSGAGRSDAGQQRSPANQAPEQARRATGPASQHQSEHHAPSGGEKRGRP